MMQYNEKELFMGDFSDRDDARLDLLRKLGFIGISKLSEEDVKGEDFQGYAVGAITTYGCRTTCSGEVEFAPFLRGTHTGWANQKSDIYVRPPFVRKNVIEREGSVEHPDMVNSRFSPTSLCNKLRFSGKDIVGDVLSMRNVIYVNACTEKFVWNNTPRGEIRYVNWDVPISSSRAPRRVELAIKECVLKTQAQNVAAVGAEAQSGKHPQLEAIYRNILEFGKFTLEGPEIQDFKNYVSSINTSILSHDYSSRIMNAAVIVSRAIEAQISGACVIRINVNATSLMRPTWPALSLVPMTDDLIYVGKTTDRAAIAAYAALAAGAGAVEYSKDLFSDPLATMPTNTEVPVYNDDTALQNVVCRDTSYFLNPPALIECYRGYFKQRGLGDEFDEALYGIVYVAEYSNEIVAMRTSGFDNLAELYADKWFLPYAKKEEGHFAFTRVEYLKKRILARSTRGVFYDAYRGKLLVEGSDRNQRESYNRNTDQQFSNSKLWTSVVGMVADVIGDTHIIYMSNYMIRSTVANEQDPIAINLCLGHSRNLKGGLYAQTEMTRIPKERVNAHFAGNLSNYFLSMINGQNIIDTYVEDNLRNNVGTTYTANIDCICFKGEGNDVLGIAPVPEFFEVTQDDIRAARVDNFARVQLGRALGLKSKLSMGLAPCYKTDAVEHALNKAQETQNEIDSSKKRHTVGKLEITKNEEEQERGETNTHRVEADTKMGEESKALELGIQSVGTGTETTENWFKTESSTYRIAREDREIEIAKDRYFEDLIVKIHRNDTSVKIPQWGMTAEILAELIRTHDSNGYRITETKKEVSDTKVEGNETDNNEEKENKEETTVSLNEEESNVAKVEEDDTIPNTDDKNVSDQSNIEIDLTESNWEGVKPDVKESDRDKLASLQLSSETEPPPAENKDEYPELKKTRDGLPEGDERIPLSEEEEKSFLRRRSGKDLLEYFKSGASGSVMCTFMNVERGVTAEFAKVMEKIKTSGEYAEEE